MMAGDDILSTVTHVIVVSLRCMSFYIGVPDINSMFIEFCNIWMLYCSKNNDNLGLQAVTQGIN
jgi:hypothetical protein